MGEVFCRFSGSSQGVACSILRGERGEVISVFAVVGHPVGNSRADGDGFEAALDAVMNAEI